VNLAGVVAESHHRRSTGGWDNVLDQARRSNAALDGDLSTLTPSSDFLGAGPVYFTGKPPAEGGILMAGDAAGVLDPFSGEGQACALSSGILAARTLEKAFDGGVCAGTGRIGLCVGVARAIPETLRLERGVPKPDAPPAAGRRRGAAGGRKVDEAGAVEAVRARIACHPRSDAGHQRRPTP
jgi:hypothetical protein